MKKLLFEKTFEKAKLQSGKTTKNGVAEHLSNLFTDDYKFPIAQRTLVRHFDKFIIENENQGNDPRTDLLDVISKYLEYENFEDFVLKNRSERGNKNKKPINQDQENIFKSNKILWLVSGIAIVTLVIMMSINQPRWMVWEVDHYVEVSFDTDKYTIGQLKLYKEDRIIHFKKIAPNCDTTFFNDDGSVKIWYGKNTKKELEYFTSLALHPETGKTLKSITTYMIHKYICP